MRVLPCNRSAPRLACFHAAPTWSAPPHAATLTPASQPSTSYSRPVACSATTSPLPAAPPGEDEYPLFPIAEKVILVLGGTGRVGASSAAALLQLTPGHAVTLAGRKQESYDATIARRPELSGTQFLSVDIYDQPALEAALTGTKFDLVLHCAGPFQRRTDLSVLRACIVTRTPYIDVCDDQDYSVLTKELHEEARTAGVPCLTTAGIYPGVSNVMAAHMIGMARKEYDADLNYRVPDRGEGVQPIRLLYSYFTAGTGGAGPTILETTFLLAGEPTIAYKDNKKFVLPPVSERRTVDFGPGLGKRSAWLYNLPEVKTGHEVMGVPNVSARFGTAPDIWNWATWLLARLAPRGFLDDNEKVAAFVRFVDPVVRATDALAGEAVGMRVEIELEGGKQAVGLYVHKLLSETVGTSTAGFAEALLEGGTLPGVWYPEEREALNSGNVRLRVMHRSARGYTKPAFRFLLNKPLWAIESDPKFLALGMYL